jgi:FkbM family methyltransferase
MNLIDRAAASAKRRCIRSAECVLRAFAAICRPKSLPTRFNGRWQNRPPHIWKGLRDIYEPFMADVIRARLRPGDSFVDAGAHYGFWSAYAAGLIGPAGVVLSFEPSPAFLVLEEMIACNGGGGHLRAIHAGLGEADGEAVFFAQGEATTGSFVEEVTRINAALQPGVPITGEAVRVRTLDGALAEMGLRPRLVKVDVEGHEVRVLKGAVRALADPGCAWVIEVHPPQLKLAGGSEEELVAMLERDQTPGAGRAKRSVRVIDRNPNSVYTLLCE